MSIIRFAIKHTKTSKHICQYAKKRHQIMCLLSNLTILHLDLQIWKSEASVTKQDFSKVTFYINQLNCSTFGVGDYFTREYKFRRSKFLSFQKFTFANLSFSRNFRMGVKLNRCGKNSAATLTSCARHSFKSNQVLLPDFWKNGII